MRPHSQARLGMPSPRTLLAVFAHPDDESFGVGGTLALYARQSVSVHLVCATLGEAGSVPQEMLQGFSSIAKLRETELRCAASHLGLTSVHLLGYRDSGMPGTADNHHPHALMAAPLEEVTARITHLIRGLKPQVVVTFDPVGGYRHPDHIVIHAATVQAFEAAADPRRFPDGLPAFRSEKLYFHTFSRRLLRVLVRTLEVLGRDIHHFGRNADIDLADIASVSFPVHARINIRSVANAKARAAACHASQMDPSTGSFLRWSSRILGSTENFTRAFPPPFAGLREGDLFEGLDKKGAEG